MLVARTALTVLSHCFYAALHWSRWLEDQQAPCSQECFWCPQAGKPYFHLECCWCLLFMLLLLMAALQGKSLLAKQLLPPAHVATGSDHSPGGAAWCWQVRSSSAASWSLQEHSLLPHHWRHQVQRQRQKGVCHPEDCWPC